MSEQNKKIVRQGLEDLFGKGKLEAADELFAPDFVGHDPAVPNDLHGREEFKQYVRGYRTAFPDLEVTIEDQIAEGDEVVTRWTARGTHRGELMGIAPTGKQVVMTGTSIDRLVDGKGVESWNYYDLLGIMQQLGVASMPQPRAAE